MGTQQLLLIVLGVIIVGIAIAVGITIFNNQAYNNNRQAVATELNTYGTNAMQWWKTPTSQGGAGRTLPTTGADDAIAQYIGFGASADSILVTNTGSFKVISATTEDDVVIEGIGTDSKNSLYPKVEATVNLVTGSITTNANLTAEDAEDFTD
jgi:hypothetical protein